MTLRSRREYNTHDATNVRLVEHWQTDAPQLINSRRDVSGAAWWLDMNPTASRLYREDLSRAAPFQIPSASSPVTKKSVELGFKTSDAIAAVQKQQEMLRATPNSAVVQSTYNEIQKLGNRKAELQTAKEELVVQKKETEAKLKGEQREQSRLALTTLLQQNQERQTFLTQQIQQIDRQSAALNAKLAAIPNAQATTQRIQSIQTKQLEVETLNLQQKQVQVDTLSENPYFNKYDVAGDSRNIIRELRGAVSEDIVDRGLRESPRLLAREMENRWLPPNYAETQGLNTMQAYNLLRPKFNDMSRSYR